MKLSDASRVLADAGVPSPEWDARLLAAHVLGINHMAVPTTEELPPEVEPLLARRAQREPLQYILGTAPFGPLDLAVGPGVFIPRPETELLADWAVRHLRHVDTPRVADLCAGSGALGLYIATQIPRAELASVEKHPDALPWLRRNAAEHAPHVQVVHADATDPALLREWDGTVDLIVTNPPYVPESPDLAPEVYADPPEAVFAGPDGMALIPRMMDGIARLLADGGRVGIEHDETTAEQVAAVLREHGGFTEVTSMADLTGRPRFTTARRSNIETQ